MLIGLSGKKQSGKDTVCNIIQYFTSVKEYSLSNKEHRMWKDYPYADYISFTKQRGFFPTSDWKRKSFADKLKDIVRLLLNCTREQLEDNEFKEKELGKEWWVYKIGKQIYTLNHFKDKWTNEDFNIANERFLIKLTPRKLLQLIGTECGRQIIHPNIWVNALMSEYRPNHEFSCDRCENVFYNKIEIPSRFVGYTENEFVCPYCKGEESEGDLTTMFDSNGSNWIITDVRFPNELKAIEDKDGIVIRIERNLESKDNHESEIALDNHKFKYTIMNDGSIEQLIEMVQTVLKDLKIIQCI